VDWCVVEREGSLLPCVVEDMGRVFHPDQPRKRRGWLGNCHKIFV
jgi:hypothetical protein